MTYNPKIPQKPLCYIGAEIGQCAGVDGCQDAVQAFLDTVPSIDDKMALTVEAQNHDRGATALPALASFSNSLALSVQSVMEKGYLPIVIGGDHSCGIGTWSGVFAHRKNQAEDPALNAQNDNQAPLAGGAMEDANGGNGADASGNVVGNADSGVSTADFGLLWIDAHLDLHTLESSDSKNLHGTPVATLLGEGDSAVTSILNTTAKVRPENVFFIGVRSFESPEQALAEKLGVRIYYMDEVNQKGFATCLQEVIKGFQDRGLPYGISLDIDSIDESEVSAVGTPTPGGIYSADMLEALQTQDFTGLEALEFVEYNPRLDSEKKTFAIAKNILACFDKDIV